jgi:hypothetical protein
MKWNADSALEYRTPFFVGGGIGSTYGSKNGAYCISRSKTVNG